MSVLCIGVSLPSLHLADWRRLMGPFYPSPGRVAVLAAEEELSLGKFETVSDFLFFSVADDESRRERAPDGERRSEVYELFFRQKSQMSAVAAPQLRWSKPSRASLLLVAPVLRSTSSSFWRTISAPAESQQRAHNQKQSWFATKVPQEPAINVIKHAKWCRSSIKTKLEMKWSKAQI